MKIRDTAISNEGRLAAGRWLKKLREARGLSQSELATQLNEPHYTFISQLETGRRSIPTFHIDKLAAALGVPRQTFAMELLRHQDAFMHAALFGTDHQFAELIRLSVIERVSESFSLEAPILEALERAGQAGLKLVELQARVEEAIGRKLHYQSVSQTLRKLEKGGRVVRSLRLWKAHDPAPVYDRA